MIRELAFPNDKAFPTQSVEPGYGNLVLALVALQLRTPILDFGFRRGSPFAILVLMPKAAVDEDRDLSCGQHQIGSAGKFLVIADDAEAALSEDLLQGSFGCRSLPTHGLHVSPALLLGEDVHPAYRVACLAFSRKSSTLRIFGLEAFEYSLCSSLGTTSWTFAFTI